MNQGLGPYAPGLEKCVEVEELGLNLCGINSLVGPDEFARHVIRCYSTQEARVQCALDDVASNICQALLAGELPGAAQAAQAVAQRQPHRRGARGAHGAGQSGRALLRCAAPGLTCIWSNRPGSKFCTPFIDRL